MIEIKPSRRGMLHKALGVEPGKKIGMADLMKAKSRAKKSGDTKLEKEAVFAENARKWKH